MNEKNNEDRATTVSADIAHGAAAYARLAEKPILKQIAINQVENGYLVVIGPNSPFSIINAAKETYVAHSASHVAEIVMMALDPGHPFKVVADTEAALNADRASTEVPPTSRSFRKELEALLNSFSRENESNTPDFILADFLERSLYNFNYSVNKREAFCVRENPEIFD